MSLIAPNLLVVRHHFPDRSQAGELILARNFEDDISDEENNQRNRVLTRAELEVLLQPRDFGITDAGKWSAQGFFVASVYYYIVR